MEDFKEIFEKIIEKMDQGDIPFLLVLAFFLVLQWLLIKKVYDPRIKDKDAEIKRLVHERDRFQDAFLHNRLHAGLDEQGRELPPRDPELP